MEAYKVWVTLNLKGDALTKMNAFIAATKKATEGINRLKLAMKPTVNMFDHMSVNLRDINPQLTAMAHNINKVDVASKNLNRTKAVEDRISMGGGKGGAGIGGHLRGHMHLGGGYSFGGGSLGFLGLVGAASAVQSSFHQGVEYDRIMARLEARGLTNSQLAYARSSTSGIKPGISQVHQLDAFESAMMATQSFDMAKVMAPIVAQNAMASSVLFGKKMSQGQVQDAMRTAEMIGGSDPKKIAEALTTVFQMSILSGGTIKPSDQRTFMRQAAGAAAHITPQGYLSLEPVIQEYGASRAGTAYTSGLRAFTNPQITNFAKYHVKELEKLGMWDSKTHMMKKDLLNLYETDPLMFALQWKNHLQKGGITSPQAITEATTSDLPRTTGILINLILKNMDKELRERLLIQGLPKNKELMGMVTNTAPGALYRLTEAWASFSEAIYNSKGTISILNGLAFVLEKMASSISSPDPGSLAGTLKHKASTGAGSQIASLFSGTDLTSSSSNKSNNHYTGDVFLDAEKVGMTLWRKAGNSLWHSQIAASGLSGSNLASSPSNPSNSRG